MADDGQTTIDPWIEAWVLQYHNHVNCSVASSTKSYPVLLPSSLFAIDGNGLGLAELELDSRDGPS